MAKHYLDFEKPIQEFEEKIIKLQSLDNDSANVLELERLINRRDKKIDEIYGNLNRWQRVQLARHPERPYSLDYVGGIVDEFVELHGDRAYADDKAIIGGIGKINERSVLFIGQQKGRNTKDNLYRNFGFKYKNRKKFWNDASRRISQSPPINAFSR